MKNYLLLLIGSLQVGCAQFPETESIQNLPQKNPVSATTGFTNAISCMDNLLGSVQQSPLTLVADNIYADPGLQPILKEMLIHAIIGLSAHNNAVQYIDYDPRPGPSYLILNDLIRIRGFIPPNHYVRGALAGEAVRDGKVSVGAATTYGHGSVSAVKALNNMVLALSLGTFHIEGKRVSPQIDQKVSYAYTFIDDQISGRLSGNFISDLGLSISVGWSGTESQLAVLQALVEIAVIELVGRELDVPYWTCLQTQSVEPEFRESVMAWYERTAYKNRLRYAQQVLKQMTYYHGKVDGKMGNLTREAVSRFQRKHQLIPTGLINYNFFLAMAELAPGIESLESSQKTLDSNLP